MVLCRPAAKYILMAPLVMEVDAFTSVIPGTIGRELATGTVRRMVNGVERNRFVKNGIRVSYINITLFRLGLSFCVAIFSI